MKHSLIAFALLTTACGAQTTARPASTPAPQATVEADAGPAATVAATDDASVTDDAAQTAQTTPEAPPMSDDEKLVRGIADGSVALTTAVDPARGILMIDYIEAMPNGSPKVARQRRVCGARITSDASVRTAFQSLVTQAQNFELTCENNVCHVGGMEYQPSYIVKLDTLPSGQRIVWEVQNVSEASLGEAWQREVAAYVTRTEASTRRTPCPRR